MEAHALVARMGRDLPFPFVCLLVSGGHNLLLTAHGIGEYTLLGSTLDDAIGARVSLLLPYLTSSQDTIVLDGDDKPIAQTPPGMKLIRRRGWGCTSSWLWS